LIKCNSDKNLSIAQNEKCDILKCLVKVEKLKIEGPTPRSFQTAIFYKKYIALFGGKSDRAVTTGEYCFNDLTILDLELLQYQPIAVYGFVPSKRWGHVMTMDKDKILVFGGVSETRLASATVYTLELDSKQVKQNLNECKKIKKLLEVEGKRVKLF